MRSDAHTGQPALRARSRVLPGHRWVQVLGRLVLIGGLLALAATTPDLTSARAAPRANRPPAQIELPAAGARTTLPLHILARTGVPGVQILVVLRWRDGTELTQTFTTLPGEDGRGLLIGNLDWPSAAAPQAVPTQPAVLELRDSAGGTVRQPVTVLGPEDPDTREITLYWVVGDDLQPTRRRIPEATQIGATALEELLWGPAPDNPAGLLTALPSPAEVLSYPGRQADWGARVRLRTLTIQDGVATADFSRELAAYGGGSTRVDLIEEQIARTLLQFPTVHAVRITVEGEPDTLQP